MTWNLKGSGGPPIDRVAEVVRDHAPDVLVVQEIRRHQACRLAATLGWSRSWHRKHHPYGPLAFWTTEGMALFTPHRLTATTALSLTPSISTWTYRHRVLVHGLVSRDDATAYRVFDVHLASDADGVSDRRDQVNSSLVCDRRVVRTRDRRRRLQRRSAGRGRVDPDGRRPHRRLAVSCPPSGRRRLHEPGTRAAPTARPRPRPQTPPCSRWTSPPVTSCWARSRTTSPSSRRSRCCGPTATFRSVPSSGCAPSR